MFFIPYGTGSCPPEALDFLLGPGDRLIDRFPTLGTMRDQFCHRSLRVHLVGDPRRGGGSRDRQDYIAARRVVEEGSLRRTFLRPDREIAEFLVYRYVIAAACVDQRLDRRALRQEGKQAFRGRLVPGEFPDPPEPGYARLDTSFRPLGRRKGPELLGDLWRVAHRDRPGGRRVEDQRALARNQVSVVAGVIPGEYLLRQ